MAVAMIRPFCFSQCRVIFSTIQSSRCYSTQNDTRRDKSVTILSKEYDTSSATNITPSILKRVGKSLHNRPHHPLNLIRNRIQYYFYQKFVSRTGKPVFVVLDNLSPVVTLQQNFDGLLVPPDHPSRQPKVILYLCVHSLMSVSSALLAYFSILSYVGLLSILCVYSHFFHFILARKRLNEP